MDYAGSFGTIGHPWNDMIRDAQRERLEDDEFIERQKEKHIKLSKGGRCKNDKS